MTIQNEIVLKLTDIERRIDDLVLPEVGAGTVISGSGVAGQVTYWTAPAIIAGDAGFTYNAGTDTISLVGGITLTGGATSTILVNDNAADVLGIEDAGGIEYLKIISTDAQPIIRFNDGGVDVDFHVEAVGVADALFVRGSDGQITLGALGAGYVNSDAGGVLSVTATATPTAHNILSASHGDTLAAAVSRGSIMYGNATPAWADLAHPGAAGYALTTDATDVMWDQTPTWTGRHTFNAGIELPDGQSIGITGNELITVNAAGTIQVSGVSGFYVEDGDYIGAGAGCAWLYDSSNGNISTTVNVGIGTASPSYPLVVYSGASGATPPASADDLVIENNGAVGISILFPDANTGLLNFGTNTDGTGCRVLWDYPNTVMKVGTTSTGSEVVIDAGNNNEVIRVKTTGVGIFDSTPDATLDVSERDAVTAAITDIEILEHLTSGTAAANFGGGLLYQLEGAGGGSVDAAQIAALWSDATAGAETSLLMLSPMHAGGTEGHWALWSYDAIAGVAITAIPGGAYDVTQMLYVWGVVNVSGVGPSATSVLATPGGGAANLYSAGANTLQLTVAAGGDVTIVRTAGAATYQVFLMFLWI